MILLDQSKFVIDVYYKKRFVTKHINATVYPQDIKTNNVEYKRVFNWEI